MDLSRTAAIVFSLILFIMPVAAADELVGVVRLNGPVPAPERLTIEPKTGTHSTEGCGDLTKISPKLLVDPGGGVQNAVVWLETPASAQRGLEKNSIVLDQRSCVFTPHVLIVPLGDRLVIRNADSTGHNVRIFRDRQMLMNQWQIAGGPELVWRFDTPGRYLVRCGVHSWMYGWVVATPHDYYAVTDAAGAFRIPAVPAGRYRLHVWHETLGEKEQSVRVEGGESITVEFEQP